MLLVLLLLLLLLLMMIEMTSTGRRPRARRSCIFDQYFMLVARRLAFFGCRLQRSATMLLALILLFIAGCMLMYVRHVM